MESYIETQSKRAACLSLDSCCLSSPGSGPPVYKPRASRCPGTGSISYCAHINQSQNSLISQQRAPPQAKKTLLTAPTSLTCPEQRSNKVTGNENKSPAVSRRDRAEVRQSKCGRNNRNPRPWLRGPIRLCSTKFSIQWQKKQHRHTIFQYRRTLLRLVVLDDNNCTASTRCVVARRSRLYQGAALLQGPVLHDLRYLDCCGLAGFTSCHWCWHAMVSHA